MYAKYPLLSMSIYVNIEDKQNISSVMFIMHRLILSKKK